MRAGRVAAALVLGLASFAASPSNNGFDAIAPPPRTAFAQDEIERGANLAAIGNCSGCHTLPHQPPYAGGVPIKTPFGTIYGSNVTPDPRTGIGTWSEAAFMRAMREGMARDGRYLYPAFPYDHFTLGTDADLRALYAFLMTRTPVAAETPPGKLRFPFGLRTLMAGWKLLFLLRGPYLPDPAQDAQWNRGAYLARGLAHCGACHTPRNPLGAERRDQPLAGGEAEGWYAPPLNADSPSPQPWNVDALVAYLRTGITPGHAIAGGPMQAVVASLARASEEDVRAIAVYVLSQMGTPSAQATQAAADNLRRASVALDAAPADHSDPQMQLGAAVYAAACAACHEQGRRAASDGALRMPLALALYEKDPRGFLRIVREGITPPHGESGRWMPSYATTLTDEQLTALAAYLRRHAARQAPWPDLARAVSESRP